MKKLGTLLKPVGGGAPLSFRLSGKETRDKQFSLSDSGVARLHAGLFSFGKAAFTLSEVLITLGIIGVVSALTLPSLVKNHQRQVFVTQLQKVVTELSQAAEKAISDNNAVSLAETRFRSSRADAAGNFLTTYFKVNQTCTAGRTPCMAASYEDLNGQAFGGWRFDVSAATPCVSLASGASICMQGGISPDDGDIHGQTYLYIDTNGPQGPNILGRDLYYTELYSDGKVAEGYTTDRSELCGDSTAAYGVGCFSKVVNDGWRMDY